MDIEFASGLTHSALVLALTLLAPVLACVFVGALATGLMQAVTQIQDQSLSVVPRIAIGVLVLLMFLPWMLDQISVYTVDLYRSIQIGP
ncbi:MAG: EscS/YscS/HrcS family type III secretion system export apparatus protein [Planctomycetota bacterium]|nr:MAG: EscS/YscS/HrcS family type III secretion system export apparatus protein [Planctomycetota bacterium]